jgi:hypothetical protein
MCVVYNSKFEEQRFLPALKGWEEGDRSGSDELIKGARKRPVLLLELLISLVLFGFIFTILFSSFQELSRSKFALRKDKEIILPRQKLQLRLTQIFSTATKVDCEVGTCLLAYDNSLDPDEDFRGPLEGMFYIDAGRLAFVTWSKNGKGRKEILYDSADFFTLSFFDEKIKDWNPNYPEQKPFMMKIALDSFTIPLFL